MESKETAAQQLRELERAEAAPYVDYPPTPGWYPWAVGVWTTLMFCFMYATLVGDWQSHWSSAVLLVLVLAELAFLFWYRRYRGSLPAFGKAPGMPEIRSAFRTYLRGAAATLAVVVVAAWIGGIVVGAVVTFVLVTVEVHRYEKLYARAAAAVRERLA